MNVWDEEWQIAKRKPQSFNIETEGCMWGSSRQPLTTVYPRPDDQMPIIKATLFRDEASMRSVLRVLPDIKTPITPRYCPVSKVLKRRTRAERTQRLDALETRSTLVAA